MGRKLEIEAKHKQVRRMLKSDMTQREIAREVGMSRSGIAKIVANGKKQNDKH